MFSKKPAAEARSATVANPATSNRGGNAPFSILGADLVVKGNVTATADLHVDGSIEGDISCDALVQGSSSVIEGAVLANGARLSGTVKGAINVSHLVILSTAHILGDVTYDALTIEQGAQVEGRLAPRQVATATEPPLTLVS
jgi:cytoskeletal protein CcmA (bactofilin family)